ncbi:MAG: hypothetical protein F6K36_15505 [Symploca sp. SIO3C6]|uniref:CHAT domain-containing protein n=1 Tax=Symploca sp. SIO1C4 TaxID=2607765 RepID=A0A6B3NB55_9CYAN|nr:hypothetical protein [Symploca sp. SIO3C6]NER28820.1 hypothetical protein [Symploca sp. SIO1C4]
MNFWEVKVSRAIAFFVGYLVSTELHVELDSKITKAQALRQVQIALINCNYTGLANWGFQQRDSRSLPPEGDNRFSHPYYWAPLILIANGF